MRTRTPARVGRVAAVLLGALPALAAAWQTLVPGTPAPSRLLALATAGTDVFAVGRVQGPDDVDAFAIALAGHDGSLPWTQRITGDAAGGDTLEAVAVDGAGDVVVAGQSRNGATGLDALVMKLAGASGASLWRRDLDGGGLTSDDALDVKVLPNGDAVVAGRVSPDDGRGPFAVWRLAAANGATLWEANVDGANGVARRLALAADAVLVAGHVGTATGGRAIVVAEIALADGTVRWHQEITGTLAGAGTDTVDAIAVRGADQVVVGGMLEETGGDEDFAVVALARSGDGAEAWRQVLRGTGTDADRARRVAVAADGDVIAAGDVANASSGDDWLVVRLDGASGAVEWRAEVDGQNQANDTARGMVLDSQGHVLAAGRLRNPGVSGDVAVLKLDGTSGAVLWQSEIDGAEESNDIAFDVAADANDDVLVAARTQNGDGADEATVLKLSGVSGASFPCGDGMLDPGEECDDGNASSDDGCRTDCTIPVCGDGIVDADEECDAAGPASCCSETCDALADDTACDDGNGCTTGDACLAGACGGAPVVCTPASECEASVCDPNTGACVVTAFDGDLCDDGDACTLVDRCREGACVSGPAAFCDDGDACTIDTCDPQDGCLFTRLDGFEGALCTFDPSRTGACLAGVPRALQKRLDRAERLLGKASASTKARKTRRLVKRAVKQLRKGQKKAIRLTERAKITAACGAALTEAFAESLAPAEALQETL